MFDSVVDYVLMLLFSILSMVLLFAIYGSCWLYISGSVVVSLCFLLFLNIVLLFAMYALLFTKYKIVVVLIVDSVWSYPWLCMISTKS